MSLDTVVEDIRNEAKEQAQEIIEEAEAEAEAIIDEAEAEADRIRQNAKEEVEREIEREREQRLSSAKLEAKQERLEARRDALSEVRERVEAEIESLPESEREALTRELLDAASGEFEDADRVLVRGRSEDESLLEGIIEEYEGYELAGEYDCLGGVVVESPEGRIRINNTFDSVLEDVWEDHLKEFSDTLFEEQ